MLILRPQCAGHCPNCFKSSILFNLVNDPGREGLYEEHGHFYYKELFVESEDIIP